jgi:hypothetical protein
MKGEAMEYVLAVGNPFDGMKLFGPFESVNKATEWGEAVYPNETWFIVTLEPANE